MARTKDYYTTVTKGGWSITRKKRYKKGKKILIGTKMKVVTDSWRVPTYFQRKLKKKWG